MATIKTKRERVKFASDNVAGACPEVLEALLKANEGDSAPYGNDDYSKSLQKNFQKYLKRSDSLSIASVQPQCTSTCT